MGPYLSEHSEHRLWASYPGFEEWPDIARPRKTLIVRSRWWESRRSSWGVTWNSGAKPCGEPPR